MPTTTNHDGHRATDNECTAPRYRTHAEVKELLLSLLPEESRSPSGGETAFLSGSEKLGVLGYSPCPEGIRGMLDYIDEQFGTRVQPGCAASRCYLLHKSGDVNPYYLLASLFVLLLSGAKIKLLMGPGDTPLPTLEELHKMDDPGMEEIVRLMLEVFGGTRNLPYKPVDMGRMLTRLTEVDARVELISDLDIDEVVRLDPDVDFVVILGNFPYSNWRIDSLRGYNLPFFLPSATLVVVDYSEVGAHRKDEKKIRVLDELIGVGLLDYEAYRTPNNKAVLSDCARFDYFDQLGDAYDEIWRIHGMSALRGGVTTIVLTDKHDIFLGLPASATDRCNIILSDDYDPTNPYYDFSCIVCAQF